MQKSVLALIAAFALASVAITADAQRGGGGGGRAGGGGGASIGGPSGGGGGGHGGGTSGGGGWQGGYRGGGHSGGWHGGYGGGYHGWRGGYWGGGWYGGGVGVYLGGPWWGLPYWGAPYYDYGYAYGYPYGYSAYPGYAAQDPVVYAEQPQANAPAAAPPSAPTVSWFYCTNPPGYYPYVQSCSKPWIRVVPDATQPPPGSPQQLPQPQ